MPETVYRSLTEQPLNAIHLGLSGGPAEVRSRGLVTESQRLRRGRAILALDPLSGLPDRRSTATLLAQECARAAATRAAVSVVVVGFEGLGEIAARQGSSARDEALRRCACLLRRLTRTTDGIGRLEGDEFLLVLPVWAADAWRCVERLRAAVAQMAPSSAPNGSDGRATCTLSAGIASSEWPLAEDGSALLRQARAALAGARQAGGNRIRIAPLPDASDRIRRAG